MRKRANRRYRRGNDFFRPGLAAGPPDARRLARAFGPPEALSSVAGEGFWSRQQLFLFPIPCSLGRSPRQIRIYLHPNSYLPIYFNPKYLSQNSLDVRVGMAWRQASLAWAYFAFIILTVRR